MQIADEKTDAIYVMGHPTGEELRLQRLGQLLYPSTKRLFEQAGIKPGMKVLDVGSGTGEVALLLAELIGPKGSIVGVDIYPRGLDIARARVRAAGFKNATFLTGDIRTIVLDNDFDAVVGRNVLIYLANPAEGLHICASHLKPGGVVAFQEVELSITEQVTKMDFLSPRTREISAWILGGFRRARAEMSIGFKFPAMFLDANLPLPRLSFDGVVGMENGWVGYDFFADILRDTLPKLREFGVLKEDVDPTAYVELLREEVIEQRNLVPIFFVVNAWATKQIINDGLELRPALQTPKRERLKRRRYRA